MSLIFDPFAYTSVPTRTPASTLSLARALISAAVSRPPTSVAKRLLRLRERAQQLQAVWIEANRPSTSDSVRELDSVLDRRWSALRARLLACLELGDRELARRAETLLATLLPTGLDFLTLPYQEQWAQSERRLELIDRDGLEDEIGELAGERFLPSLREAHAAHGAALGITEHKSKPAVASVLEPLRRLQAAIGSYARGVVGSVDEEDEEAVARAMAQLEPILRARRLEDAGWVVQDYRRINTRAARGVAVREFPMKRGHGVADYVGEGGVGRAGAVFEGRVAGVMQELTDALVG